MGRLIGTKNNSKRTATYNHVTVLFFKIKFKVRLYLITERIVVTRKMNVPLANVFNWMAHSENYAKSPLGFRANWQQANSYKVGAIRDIVMLAGCYQEEITKFVENKQIQYRVNRLISKVHQYFTEDNFTEVSDA